MKHTDGWQLTKLQPHHHDTDNDNDDSDSDGDGDLAWITPAGRKYLIRREPADPSIL